MEVWLFWSSKLNDYSKIKFSDQHVLHNKGRYNPGLSLHTLVFSAINLQKLVINSLTNL